jgi:hypothetical protein
LELLLLPVAPSRQAPGLDVREQAPATNSPCNSVLPALEPPLEELELLDELLLDRFATANDDGTETWLKTLLKILDGLLVLSRFDFA